MRPPRRWLCGSPDFRNVPEHRLARPLMPSRVRRSEPPIRSCPEPSRGSHRGFRKQSRRRGSCRSWEWPAPTQRPTPKRHRFPTRANGEEPVEPWARSHSICDGAWPQNLSPMGCPEQDPCEPRHARFGRPVSGELPPQWEPLWARRACPRESPWSQIRQLNLSPPRMPERSAAVGGSSFSARRHSRRP